jgi:cytochrome c-type biogenesis protein CcmH
MKPKYFFLATFSFLLLVLLILPAFRVSAQTPTPPSDDAVNAIAHQLFCPICVNTPLDVCPTEACRQWRELIRQMLVEGKSEAEIKQYFVDNYGVRVLGAPPAKEINWLAFILAYIVPWVGFLIGAFLLFLAFRAWRRMEKEPAAESRPEGPPVTDDKYAVRLEEELRKRR